MIIKGTSFAPWVVAAQADGWLVDACYPGHEAAESYARLRKNGFVAHYDNRTYPKATIPIGRLSIWGPDGLAIGVTPEMVKTYDWNRIVAGLKMCNYCPAENVETTGISFAGRCCLSCRRDPKLTARLEYPGWCD